MRYFVIAASVLAVVLATGCARPPDSTSDGSDLQTPPTRGLDFVRAELASIKEELAEEGNYKCCIRPTCNYCALGHGSCPCATDLQEGRGVCGECYGGWRMGQGTLERVNPEEVGLAASHAHEEEGEAHESDDHEHNHEHD